MRFLSFISLILFSSSIANSQVLLPKLEPAKTGGGGPQIIGTYIPQGTFARLFPTFSTDGQYYLNYKIPQWDETRGSYDSKDFPELLTESKTKYQDFVPVLVTFTTDAPLFDQPGTLSVNYDHKLVEELKTDRELPDQDKTYGKLFKRIYEEYTQTDQQYKSTTNTILNEKGITKLTLVDVDMRDYRSAVLQPGTVILDVRLAKTLMLNDKVSKDFPSFNLFTLTVKNAFGEKIKTYNQMVFTSLKIPDFQLKDIWQVQRLASPMFTQTYKIALQSLVNQWLNDTPILKQIGEDHLLTNEKILIDPAYKKVFDTKVKYGALLARLEELTALSNEAKGNFNQFAGLVTSEQNSAPVYLPSSLNTTQVNQVGQATSSLLINLMNRSSEKEHINEMNARATQLNALVAQYKRQTADFVGEVSSLPPSDDQKLLLSEIVRNDNQLADAVEHAVEAHSNALKNANLSSTSTNGLVQNLNSALQGMGSKGGQSAAVTAVSGSSADACTQQATTAWKNSPEYQTYMRSKLNADASDCKAKMIELTIQYCGSKLSAKEVEDYKKIALQERQTATELRNGGFGFKK